MNNKKPNMILIMDGYGLNPRTMGNAIAQAYLSFRLHRKGGGTV